MILKIPHPNQMNKLTLLLILILIVTSSLYSQKGDFKYVFKKDKTDERIGGSGFYGGLTHHHQDFFNTPFSLTGIETGILLHHKFVLGVYGSSFVSGLEADISNSKTFLSLAQGGIVFGVVYKSHKMLHTGLLLNVGYATLTGSNSEIALFKAQNPAVTISGTVFTPQAFAELNVLRWMKFRTGLGYSFYSFENQSAVSVSDLQNVSLNFGFLFGKF